jgi:hypothetical protein
VVITRESPWTDEARARALALTEYEDSLCHCGCGLPRDVAHKKQPFTVHDFVCYAGQAIAVVRRMHKAEHKDDEKWFEGRQYVAIPADDKADDN